MIDFGRLQADVVKDWCKHSEEYLKMNILKNSNLSGWRSK